MTEKQNHFTNNRKQVQKAAIETNYLNKLSFEDLPLIFIEENNKDKKQTLKKLIIYNIPLNDIVQIAFVLNLELQESLFSKPKIEKFKTVEKAILLFTNKNLHIIMFEMKSSLELLGKGILGIEQKIKDSMSRISLFLTHYIFDEEKYNDYKIKYHCVVCYNNEDQILNQLSKNEQYKKNILVDIWKKKKGSYIETNRLGSNDNVSIQFEINPNTNNPDEFHLDFFNLFNGEIDFNSLEHSDKTLPQI